MEPRPQRPRQQPQPTSQQTAQQPAAQGQHQQPGQPRPGEYPDSGDPATFVAPLRNDYDYSPLDLAPSGQRRRRQLVAAAAGALFVAMIGAVAFLGYLLIKDDDNGPDDSVLASQTQVAETQVALGEQQTEVAGGSETETPQADDEPTEASGDEATDEPEATTEPDDESEAPTPTPDESEDEGASGGLTSEELTGILPPAEDAAPGLTETTDVSLDLDGVVTALGGSRTATTNLEQWGWSGNAARQYDPPEGEEPAATDVGFMSLSIHGFANAESAAEALPFFSNILANSGYEEVEGAATFGDSSRMLTGVNDEGATEIVLYVQQGSLLYRVTGGSLEGDATDAVTNLMEAALANGEAAFHAPMPIARLEWVR